MTASFFYLATLGCKVNQYESHALREAWLQKGWREASTPEAAALVLVNSCAVTAKAVADVRATVRRLHRAAPQADIIITGCAAEAMHDELAALPGVTQVVGQSRKADLLDRLPETHDESAISQDQPGGQGDVSAFPGFAVSGYDRSRAVLKIQDGCSHRCTYCIVPLTRGKACSRPAADSLAEARRLLASGFREIGISGVNLRQYGRDLASPHDFWDFLEELDNTLAPEWAGRARFRISSLEPGQLGEKALRVLGNSRLIAPHLHLSLQSGSPSVLRRMGRGHYDPASIGDFLKSLRGFWPVFGLGADILTAFPGETPAEFQETCDLCSSLPLTYAHVFPYSKRPGTAAAAMSGQLPSAVKKERALVLRTLIQEKKQNFLQSLLNLPVVHVVFEGRDDEEEQASGTHPTQQGPANALLRGVSEFYADCIMEPGNTEAVQKKDSAIPKVYAITPTRPVRVENDLLVVQPAPVAPSSQRFS